MSRFSPSRSDMARVRAEADAFAFDNPLNVHSLAALKRARASLRRTIKEGLCPDTGKRRFEYAVAVRRLTAEIERRDRSPAVASYRDAVDWIAYNDEPSDREVESVQGFISTLLVADIFKLPSERVARDVIALRKKESI